MGCDGGVGGRGCFGGLGDLGGRDVGGFGVLAEDLSMPFKQGGAASRRLTRGAFDDLVEFRVRHGVSLFSQLFSLRGCLQSEAGWGCLFGKLLSPKFNVAGELRKAPVQSRGRAALFRPHLHRSAPNLVHSI